MLRSTSLLRHFVTFVVLPPFAVLAAACSGDSNSPATGGKGGADATAGSAAMGSSGATASAGNTGAAGSLADGGSVGVGTGGEADAGAATDTDAGAALGPAPVLLGKAAQYAILAKSAISNVPTSMITGNLGLSPAAASYITGFSLTNAGTQWTSPQVVGSVFAADNDPPTGANLTTAVADMLTAYTDAAGRPTPDFLDLGAGTISGLTLKPGLYKWASTVTIATDIALAGAANDVWIFQVTGDLELSAAKAMTLSGGAQAKNIFWQVAGAVSFGTTSHAEGVVLSKTAIALGTGATINGRLLAQTAVNVAGSTVTAPAQ